MCLLMTSQLAPALGADPASKSTCLPLVVSEIQSPQMGGVLMVFHYFSISKQGLPTWAESFSGCEVVGFVMFCLLSPCLRRLCQRRPLPGQMPTRDRLAGESARRRRPDVDGLGWPGWGPGSSIWVPTVRPHPSSCQHRLRFTTRPLETGCQPCEGRAHVHACIYQAY